MDRPLNSLYAIAPIITLAFMVVAFAFMLLRHPTLGGPDDVFFFKTIEQGKALNYYSATFPYLDVRKLGRFTPFAGWEYNVALLMGDTAVSAQAVHAIQYGLFAIIGLYVLRYFTGSTWVALAAIAYISLSPGFVEAWFQRHLNERNLLLWLVIYLFCRIRLKETPRIYYLIGAVFAAFVAVNYRETAFIPFLGMSILWLVWGKNKSLSHKFTDLAVLIIGFGYIAYYIIEIRPQIVFAQAGIFHIDNDTGASILIKSLLLSALRDPLSFFMVTIGLPVLLFKHFREKPSQKPEFDLLVLLVGGGLMLLACWALMLFTPKYSLPTLFLSLPGLIYLVSRMNRIRWMALIATLLAAINLLKTPSSIQYYINYPYNFNQAVEFLASTIKLRPQIGEKSKIYVPHLYRGHNLFLFINEFLVYKGARNFDLLAMTEQNSGGNGYRLSLLGYFPKIDGFASSGPLSQPQRGDMIFLLEGVKLETDVNPTELAALSIDKEKTYHSGSRLLPGIDLECVARYVMSGIANMKTKGCGEAGRHKAEFEIFRVN